MDFVSLRKTCFFEVKEIFSEHGRAAGQASGWRGLKSMENIWVLLATTRRFTSRAIPH